MDHDSAFVPTDSQRAAMAFLEAEAPPRVAGDETMFVVDEAAEHDFVARGKAWQRTKFEHGWAGIAWPEAFGGQGRTALDDALFREVEHRYVSQWLTHNLGFDNIGPTIIAHGTEAQQERFIRPMLRGDHVWTLLFSEPTAGSDLGAVRTRAVLDGDEWVVNGQKVWSSRAHLADYGLLVARTDIDAPKYRGVTCFLIDMAWPGITVRPLKQINGAAHFNEVFFTDARFPADAVIGTVNAGWGVVVDTLSNERNLLGTVKSHISMTDLLALAASTGATADPVLRQRVADAYIADTILGLLGARVREANLAGRDPGPAGSVMKLSYASHVTSTTTLAIDLVGAAGMLAGASAPNGGRWNMEFIGAPATRIGGGTDEVQRNTIGEKVLGLPRDDRPDKRLPFRELRTS